ncbi:UPF0104 family protein [Methylobacterium gnaphalii]|uniref:Membrane protein n=1 Tax=Methylobacterium gnaphalii TaxID=1010610 RepID=A0A512JIX5_9HYPH|nr:UPF0104 family protein [Methylobacterium gnaphalii]GEP09901.1 membrane protein [Methylobacterium gnaphalii]GJD68323.1 hypothetical protein MMMDOFMJ_1244 [Methylobacterium gnaphalii]GLS49930.1 membrane protein [Methylobacterium gnaphalii]
MKKISEILWPIIGLGAVIVSCYLLYGQLQTLSWVQLQAAFAAIPLHHFLLAAVSTLVAYAALAWYDRIALIHLGVRHISWLFVSLCSFTTYALSHNIGASVFSGALVRYRAYTSKGLSAAQVAVLVALCSFTFGLGTLLLGGFCLVYDPYLLARLDTLLPSLLTNPTTARIVGIAMLGFVGLYVLGSILHFKPLTIRSFKVEYPRPSIMLRQLVAAPMELLGAAGIIYFALPDSLNPGFIPVLAIFLASFSVALASHAPGGLGVFELVFLAAMQINAEDPSAAAQKAAVVAAVLIFRLFYLLLPFALAIVVVLLFERSRLAGALSSRKGSAEVPEPPLVAPGLEPSKIEHRLGKTPV